eukprot:TRINITY_DN1971_c0_g1_i1.p1 TRINITY_DN1971_c0_g1~~TRINITY_DN1971_c0_g1_i1.p1  ORF type:complete len:1269 (+),score=431.18 TRINITY_DN1971_c0_g1_i1:413-4219(+)
MGQLRIRVLESRGIETKPEGVYFSFKLLSFSDGKYSKIAKAKSKVLKRNEKWGESSVTLEMPGNSIKGNTLKLSMREASSGSGWVKLKSARQPPLGELTVSLDDLITGIEKLNVIQLNPSGSIHLALEHRVDNKCRIIIAFDKEVPRAYELLRDVKLSTQIDAVCQAMKAPGNCSDYVLQVEKTWLVITKEHLLDPKFTLPDKCTVNLIINPTLQAKSAIEAIEDPTRRKRALFDLKTQLENVALAQAFIAANGIELISKMIMETTGNTLAYALVGLDFCMNYGLGLDSISMNTIEKLVALCLSKENNVRSGALKAVVHLSESKTFGYPAINASITKSNKEKFFAEVASLNLQKEIDVSVQSSTLTFFNRMLEAASPKERREFIKIMEEGGTSSMANGLISYGDPYILKQLSDYMIYRYELHSDKEPYSKENPEHERLLMLLWDTVFPEQKLDNRVSKEWAKLGFQGTDPATDFRALGVTALRFLLYCAQNHNKLFRGIIDKQIDNGSTYFPVAVAGINLMNMLFNLLGEVVEGTEQLRYMKMLYDQKFATEEMFCICLELFDRAWIDSGLDYMGFSEVISSVTDQVISNLNKSNNVAEFKGYCKTLVTQEERRGTRTRKKTINSPVVASLRKRENTKANSAQSTLKRGTLATNENPLHDLVKAGNTKQVLNRIRAGSNVNELNETGLSLLHVSVIDNNLDMLRLLLWKDANVNIKTNEGWTPLHEACKKGSIEACDILIGKGADVNAETADGLIPLHYLVSRKFDDPSQQMDVIHEMISKGVNLNSNKGSHQESPLHFASQAGRADLCKFLVANGADINPYSRGCFTPLHFGIQGNHLNVVKTLLDCGADSGYPTKDMTCLDMAKDKPAILDCLIQHPSRQPIIPPKKNTPTSTPSNGSPTIGRREGFTLGSRRGNANGTVSAVPLNTSPPPLERKPTAEFAQGTRQYQRKSFFPALEVETTRCNFFHPKITEDDAERMLQYYGKGRFLFRESDVRGSIFMSIHTLSGELQHYMVLFQNAVGFQIQGVDDQTWFQHLSEIYSKSPLCKDLKGVTNEESIEALLSDSPSVPTPTSPKSRTPPQVPSRHSISISSLSSRSNSTNTPPLETNTSKRMEIGEISTEELVKQVTVKFEESLSVDNSPSSPPIVDSPSTSRRPTLPLQQSPANVASAAAAAVQAMAGLRALISFNSDKLGVSNSPPSTPTSDNTTITNELHDEKQDLKNELNRMKEVIELALSQLNEESGNVTEETKNQLLSFSPTLKSHFKD